MNYIVRYDCGNIDGSYFVFRPSIRNGAAFLMFDCTIKFYQGDYGEFVFLVDEKYSAADAKNIIDKVCKILSYVFGVPLYQKYITPDKTERVVECNCLLGKQKLKKLAFLESNISKFNKIEPFFYDTLDLLNVAIDNLYKGRDEDAFVYFFKVIERIAKKYYILYFQRHYTRALTKNNKRELKDFIEQYALNNLHIKLTEDILNNKVDLFYKDLKMDLYGSTYGKISLFITKNEINYDMKLVSKLVHLRNKIAHGDSIEDKALNNHLFNCKELAEEMFSKHFFRTSYEDLCFESTIDVV